MAQSEKFSGFEEVDFEVFEKQGLKERIAAIKERIHSKLKLLEPDVLAHFKSHKQFPVPLYPHYPKHPNRKNLPSATWLAFGRYQNEYVHYAQLNVGLSKQFEFGVMIRLLFEIGKKSDDFPKFKKWINRDKNKKRVEELTQNGFVFFLAKEDVKNKEILYKPIKKTLSINEALDLINITSATSFQIGKQYNKNNHIVRSEELGKKVIEVFEKLYPIYRERC